MNSSNPEEYADSFTRESLNLFDDVLSRQDSWIGIPVELKKTQVTTIQKIVDESALSLIKNSKSDQHEYSNLENIGNLGCYFVRSIDFKSICKIIHIKISQFKKTFNMSKFSSEEYS